MSKYVIKVTNLNTQKVCYLDSSDTDEPGPVFRNSISEVLYNFYDEKTGQVVVNRHNETEAAWAHWMEIDVEHLYELVEIQ